MFEKTDRCIDAFHDRADADLVCHVLQGEKEAYNVLVKRFRGAVVLVAEQIVHSRDIAEDVAQEVFLVALQSLTKLRDPTRFGSWLYTIARHRASRVVRQEKRTVALDAAGLSLIRADLPPSGEAHPEKELLRAEAREELAAALANLTPETRLAFRLRYEESWTVARIAEFLALPLSTVKWRLHQARKQLRQQLLSQQKETNHE